MAEKEKNNPRDLIAGFFTTLAIAWFSSPEGMGCSRMEGDATWRSGNLVQTRHVEFEVTTWLTKEKKAAALAAAVKAIDPQAVDITYKGKDSGFCR